MNEFEKGQDSLRRRNVAEGRELGAEQKERQAEQAEKKMAAKERAEVVSREVKNTKQQIQNIMANMQAVVKAVAAIRAQLKVAQNDSNIPSVERDKKSLAALRKKLDGLMGEIQDLRVALLVEERKSVKEDNGDWNSEAVEAEANKRVQEILERLGVVEESKK